MTTQYAVLPARSGRSYTAKLFTVADPDTEVTGNTITVTERTNAKGMFRAGIARASALPAGDYILVYLYGTIGAAIGYFTFAGTDGETATETLPTAVLDSASVTAVQTGLATSASITALRGADNDTLKTLSDQIDGISSGGTDWTANERTAIRSILGVPASGTTPADPTVGILDTIRDSVATYIAGIATSASLTPGTIVGFPATLTIGDSYTDDCDSAIHVFIRDENDDPITSVGTHDFTDGDFAPECIITQNGNTGRVKCDVTYVAASPENYLKVQIPSKESRRATAGIATVQVLLKWDGAQKALSKQAVTWDGLI